MMAIVCIKALVSNTTSYADTVLEIQSHFWVTVLCITISELNQLQIKSILRESVLRETTLKEEVLFRENPKGADNKCEILSDASPRF